MATPVAVGALILVPFVIPHIYEVLWCGHTVLIALRKVILNIFIPHHEYIYSL